MKIEIKSKNNSLGVYALDQILANEKIFNLKEGIIFDYPTKYSVQIGIGKHVELLSSIRNIDQKDFFWKYLNHSCDPNAYCNIHDMSFYALEDISPGEQITFNYLTTEYEMAEPFICHCNDSHCIKDIKGFKYLTNSQKAKLLPVVSNHIRRLYENEKCALVK